MDKNDFKNLRKAAFSVAFGVTLGKFVGDYASAFLSGCGLGIRGLCAKHDNKIAKEICEKVNIKYDSAEKLEETDRVIGFRCE